MDTVADAAFCNHCGERLPARCRACDTQNPPGSAFCYSCGSPIAAAASAAPPYAPPPPIASAVCPRCSKTSEPGSAYCYSCGLPFDEPPPAYARYDSRHAQRVDDCEYARDELELAGLWVRLATYYIDAFVALAAAFAIIVIIMAVMYMAGYYDFVDGDGIDGLLTFALFALYSLYYTIGWSRWGTTAGKRIFRLYVVRTDGSKIGFWRAFGRSLARTASELILPIVFIVVLFRQDKRALHDLICDTVVIRRRR